MQGRDFIGSKTTPFAGSSALFFTMGNYEKLFAVFEAKSRKQFFIKYSEKDREGISESEFDQIVLIGLQHEETGGLPNATIEDARRLRQQYILENNAEAFEKLIPLAFANSGLIDLKEYMERVDLLDEIQKFETARLRQRLGLDPMTPLQAPQVADKGEESKKKK